MSTEVQSLCSFVPCFDWGANGWPAGEMEQGVKASRESRWQEEGKFGQLHCYRGIIKTTMTSHPTSVQLYAIGENLCTQMTLEVARYGAMFQFAWQCLQSWNKTNLRARQVSACMSPSIVPSVPSSSLNLTSNFLLAFWRCCTVQFRALRLLDMSQSMTTAKPF